MSGITEMMQPRDKRPYRKIYIHADWTLGLPRRCANALRAYGIQSREALAELPDRKIKRIPNIGCTSLKDIRAWLEGESSTAMDRSIST